ncbi:MAG TPA: glycoside hydrolase family 20 zincin-like fold domain-containing protein, partial [Ignavibacteria bacterium]|nr:glycoside hydrolase family 20 zincin-like fold domain-containing protein [Ignavibacteria bacterium]
IIFINTIKSPSIEDEGYYLSIEVNKISINARTKEGVFYGLQSLFQLMNENTDLPCLKIRDYPAFKWRGMHLDVCRHFFPKEFVKKYIDYIAMYKMNTFQ